MAELVVSLRRIPGYYIVRDTLNRSPHGMIVPLSTLTARLAENIQDLDQNRHQFMTASEGSPGKAVTGPSGWLSEQTHPLALKFKVGWSDKARTEIGSLSRFCTVALQGQRYRTCGEDPGGPAKPIIHLLPIIHLYKFCCDDFATAAVDLPLYSSES